MDFLTIIGMIWVPSFILTLFTSILGHYAKWWDLGLESIYISDGADLFGIFLVLVFVFVISPIVVFIGMIYFPAKYIGSMLKR